MISHTVTTLCLMLLLQVTVASRAFAKDTPKADEAPWWKTGVFYEIYLRSFQDTNGDGVGDLKGVIKRIDYLKDLGIDAVYLSSFYPSPNRDWGYDITDFKGVDKTYGTMADFDELVKKLHKNGIKLVIDFVANHTSDQHPWFKESRKSRLSPKNNWYIWYLGKTYIDPPTNWLSHYGGPAWEFDQSREEFYYHAFFREQPDLNWRNPEVRTAMHDVLRFWIARGVDGFVLNDASKLTENTQMVDESDNPNPYFNMPDYERHLHPHTENWTDTHTYLKEIRRVIDKSCSDCVLIIKNRLLPREIEAWYGGRANDEAHLVINDQFKDPSWQIFSIKRLLNDQLGKLGSTLHPALAFDDRNTVRIANKITPGQLLAAMTLLLTYKATPFIYYGDELGMRSPTIRPEFAKDLLEHIESGKGLGRDSSRSPMTWNGSPWSGFSTSRPWLPLSNEWEYMHTESQIQDPDSLLNSIKKLIKLRKSIAAFTKGDQSETLEDNQILLHKRSLKGKTILVAMNFGNQYGALKNYKFCKILYSTSAGAGHLNGRSTIALHPYEAIICELSQ